MIVSTAGHVDHGKTSLVKALTGVDTDRLPEEKQRGLTIEPGFAYWRLPAGPVIGFVDVPGHERFIHNLLAGVTGIDFALLVVAADDGPMPQTREHLAILGLLGVRSGAVALTKVDRVPAGRVEEVAGQTRDLLSDSTLAGVPVFPCSALSGAGVDDIARHLLQQAQALPGRSADGHFRLAVDRRFHLAGAGLIVTGTVVSGIVTIGDSVRLLQDGSEARVRSIHAQGTAAAQGRAGERCALNLVGPNLHRERIARGDWVVGGDVPPPALRIDARLRALPGQPVAHWSAVHVHLGAAHVIGRVAVLEGAAIVAGESGRVQLVLQQAIGALRGDRFIMRDASARQTLGGGTVIDVFPPARGRARPARLTYLTAMEIDDHATALSALLEPSAAGLPLDRFAANRNLRPEESALLYQRVPMKQLQSRVGPLGFAPAHWEHCGGDVIDALAEWHHRHPDRVGPAADRVLMGRKGAVLPREAVLAVVAELAREGRVVREMMGVRLPTHRPQLRPADEALWKRLQPLLEGRGLRPPTVSELAAELGDEVPPLETAMSRLSHYGLLIPVSKKRFFPLAAAATLTDLLHQEQQANGKITAAGFRDRSHLGRNLTIEVLEYFDRVGLTRRSGDGRVLTNFPDEQGRDSHPGGAPGLQIR